MTERISAELARALRDSGLVWRPAAGDAFVIDRVEADDEVFILSDMTVEAHHFPTGTELGFNGTTEWALDSVPLEDALWLPQEHQLRELLGVAFVSLTAGATVRAAAGPTAGHTAGSAAEPAAGPSGGPTVTAMIDGTSSTFEADATANAYARALLALLGSLAAE
ncbi:MAG: hypothetical protein LCH43_06315 [Actinobacteria bacterium]|nr:hypothetical protein [Actinomycetota bacterium]